MLLTFIFGYYIIVSEVCVKLRFLRIESSFSMDIIAKNTSVITSADGSTTYVVRKLSDVEDKPVYSFFKRAFDMVASFFALIVLAIPMLIIALIIVFDSKGGAFYKQERLGLNGVKFTLYKFRTMRADAEKDSGAIWAAENDERCTKVGRILRASRLDELPQLINILKGDMSIVGPRPEREVFYEEFETYIDGFSQRLRVVPGLTGLAQISGGYDLVPEEKIAYDLEYIETRSALLDLKIIFKTVAIVFNHKGAR